MWSPNFCTDLDFLCVDSLDQLLSRPHQDHCLSNHGCCHIHRRKARLQNIQIFTYWKVRLYQGGVHTSQVRQDDCRTHHAVEIVLAPPQVYLIGWHTDTSKPAVQKIPWNDSQTKHKDNLQSLKKCFKKFFLFREITYFNQLKNTKHTQLHIHTHSQSVDNL